MAAEAMGEIETASHWQLAALTALALLCLAETQARSPAARPAESPELPPSTSQHLNCHGGTTAPAQEQQKRHVGLSNLRASAALLRVVFDFFSVYLEVLVARNI
ncbi:hypothetical protein D9611_009486 [Ephemerocybe angulata]|uniref:Uncharacterized protein n=1 Tax=Ephemerocybe angulata TaxID=980116 RepID=A0A8H5AV88_9AGAR|nr:hypothetical protein D9611_009486 [Tulosesus angulatus]